MTVQQKLTKEQRIELALVQCLIELEYAHERMGSDRKATRNSILSEAHKVLGRERTFTGKAVR